MVTSITSNAPTPSDFFSPLVRTQTASSNVDPTSVQPQKRHSTEKPIPPFGTLKFTKLAGEIPPAHHSDLQLAQAFGEKVIVYSSHYSDVHKSGNLHALPEPGNDAIELLDKFSGAGNVLLISSHRSPHKLEYQPPFLKMDHATQLNPTAQGDSVFFLNTDPDELQAAAGNIPSKANVIISNNSMESVVRQVTLLQHLRKDLQIYGHASSLHDPHNHKGAIEAFRRVGGILVGKKNIVVRPLSELDSEFIREKTKVNIPAGTAIPALFNKTGELNREAFALHYKAARDDTKQKLNYALTIRANLNLSEIAPIVSESQVFDIEASGKLPVRSMSSLFVRADVSLPEESNPADPFSVLGKVLILGSTGNVGLGILNALAGRVDIDAPVRNPARLKEGADHLGTVRHPVRQLPLQEYSKGEFTADTVFIAASAPRDKGVTNRAGQLVPNLEKVMIPLMAKIPPAAKLIQVITNPCADMSYAAWLLRPDLASKITSHSGTDLVRQHAHVENPQDPETYFTFGPHSPNQVNVDLSRETIDKSIATKANDINRRSGGQATTDPTSLSSIYESLCFLEKKQSSYALPLTAEEAAQLQRFIRESGSAMEELNNIVVHEGTAPTLPRKNGQIHWELLEKARDHVPGFMQGVAEAMAELEFGRTSILRRIVEMIEERRPDPVSTKLLDAWEAERLQAFLRETVAGNQASQESLVPEGIAPALPRTNGAIDWDWLATARDNLPDFRERIAKVPEEFARGQTTTLDEIVRDAEQLRPYPAANKQIDDKWVLQNRKHLLAILNTPPATRDMRSKSSEW